MGTLALAQSSSAEVHSESHGWLSSGSSSTHSSSSSTANASSSISGSAVSMTAGHDLTVLGSKVAGTGIAAGAGQVSLTAGNTLNVVAAADTQSSHSDTHSSGGLFGSDKAQSSADLSQTTAQASSLTGSHIQLQSGSDMTLQAAQIAGQSLHAQAGVVDGQVVDPNATLHIDAAIDDLSQSRSSSGHGLLTQSTAGKGKVEQTLQYTTIDVPGASQAGGPVQLQATGGIAVGASSLGPAGSTASGGTGVPTITVDLKQQAQQLASQPGLAYLGQLAQRNDVAWQQVQLASRSWNYHQSGLTGAGAAIIAIAVAIATYGAASGLATSAATSAGMTTTAGAAGASTVAAAGAGVAGSGVAAGTVLTTTGAALSSAAAAGMSSLASEAAVSLAGNGGNIGQTLHDLGSSQSVRNIVAAMVTGGVGGALSGYSAGNLAAKTVTGCAAGAISGTGCQNGAESAAVTNAAAWTYNSMLGYDASAGPGKTPPPGTKDYPVYTPQANGQQPVDSFGNNVIGLNHLGSSFSQGSALSNALNQVPFINATAGVHDWFFNASPALNSIFSIANIPLMGVAAVGAIPAALGNNNLSYLLPQRKKFPGDGSRK